ncbi:MAG: glycosyltransferase [Lachnospiraceae bacterium]|nr:glycosyltransferase [Lachnospiraceae bacterium]
MSSTGAHLHIDVLLVSGGHGGFENIVNQTSSYLVSHGFSVRYIQLVSSGIDWATDDAAYVCLDMDKEHFDFDEARKQYASLLSEDTQKPSLILATGWPYVIYVAKGAASDAGLPVPVCAWPHDDLDYYAEGGSGDISMFQFADMSLAINQKIAEDVFRAFPEKVVYRINNCFNPAMIRYSENRDTLKIACVGRLSEKKVIPIILYALEKTKLPWELILAGDGEDEEALRALTHELHLQKRVHFLGWQSDPWAAVTDCRAHVVSSIYEGAPLSLIEALAGGMQVISTPVGIAEEAIGDSGCGYLVPFGKPDALTAVLDRLSTERFTPEMARRCKEQAAPYHPEATLYDFLCKIEACAGLTLLPQHFLPGKTDLYVRRTP